MSDDDLAAVDESDLDPVSTGDPLVPADESPFEVPDPSLPEPYADPASNSHPASMPAGYLGDPPWEAMEHWHVQEASHSCAVACQEFILDDITGIDHSEAELSAVAEANGWYTPGQGTPFAAVGKVLEYYGIPTEQHQGASVDDLAAALADGQKVMVAVDSAEMANPGGYDPDDPLDHYPGIPGQGADHVVQVIGIDTADPTRPMVVLNDPGHPGGQGAVMDLGAFAEAWEDSGNMMVTAGAT